VKPLVNAFSVDVEDWFQVSAFSGCIPRSDWEHMECRVERNVDVLLQTLDHHGTKATFFTLGWIAERYPSMVRRVVAEGHELASHGYGHQRVGELDRAGFADDVFRAKAVLEDIGGRRVEGYRAPSFSIVKDTLWAFEVLIEAGHRYSSSIYPIRHDLYGIPDAPRFAHRRGDLLEIPATSVRVMNRNLPAAGGGFFRLLPYSVSHWSMERVNTVDREPAVFYCHPWEIDPGQPRVREAPARSRFRHYVNQRAMLGKIEKLLADFSWATVGEAFADRIATVGEGPAPGAPPSRMASALG
jgi:polysaccharide deacetylase family protein (PEP-CTERM system associated)